MLEVICCPVCKGDLRLAATRKEAEEILEGSLTCVGCGRGYAIHEGIPDLLPPDE